jgi:hypothetical protein
MDLIVEKMQMAVGITQVVLVEVERAFVAKPFADIEMVVGIDVSVVAEVFAPSEWGWQLVGASIERELEVVTLIDSVKDVPRGIRRIDVDAAIRLCIVGGAAEQPRWNEARSDGRRPGDEETAPSDFSLEMSFSHGLTRIDTD